MGKGPLCQKKEEKRFSPIYIRLKLLFFLTNPSSPNSMRFENNSLKMKLISISASNFLIGINASRNIG